MCFCWKPLCSGSRVLAKVGAIAVVVVLVVVVASDFGLSGGVGFLLILVNDDASNMENMVIKLKEFVRIA